MFGLYTPVILLQAFCLYHAYRNNAEQRWYWFILLFPGIGCAFYLFHHFNKQSSIGTIAEGVKSVINSNYHIEQLEKALRFSDNMKNRVNLADAYMTCERYNDAIILYQNCLVGFMADDPALRMKLLYAHFLSQDYTEAITLGKSLDSDKTFRNADQRLAYAWALHYDGQTETSEKVFQDMDRPFTNYHHRMEYCKFLLHTDRTEDLKIKLTSLLEEFEHIRDPERRLIRDIIREAKALYSGLAPKT
jgi:hypothetical protein